MRGQTHAHLIEAGDGCAYVVKFANNPQGGRRTLVNEFIGSVLLTHLGVATPAPAFVHIGNECGSDIGPLPAGVHFGSRFPGHPDKTAVYEFLPDALLPKVHNRDHFIGAVIFDQWVSNDDARQAIFFRPFACPGALPAAERGFQAQMIDNGSAFGGRDWTFRESTLQGSALPLHGIYSRRAVYRSDLSVAAFRPWIDALMELPFQVLREAVAELPEDWIRGDERNLEGLLARLYQRRELVLAMAEQVVHSLQANRMRLPPRGEIARRDILSTG